MSQPHQVLFVPGQYATIQAAVDAVSGPATIMIEPGHYRESIEVSSIGSLVIESTRLSKRGVTLEGDHGQSVLTVRNSVVHLSGIEVRSNARMRGIDVADSSISLQECVVAGNRVGDDASEPLGAGMLCRRSTVRIQKSTIAGNTIESGAGLAAGGGLFFEDCRTEIAGSSIQVNAIYADLAARGGGIWSERTSMRMWRSRVTDNLLRGERCEGGGIYVRDSLECQLGGSVITGNGSAATRGGGIFILGDATRVVVHENTVVRQNSADDRASE